MFSFVILLRVLFGCKNKKKNQKRKKGSNQKKEKKKRQKRIEFFLCLVVQGNVRKTWRTGKQ